MKILQKVLRNLKVETNNMPILKRTKKEDKKEIKEVKETNKDSASTKKTDSKINSRDLTWVLRGPRITEKAALAAEKGTYVFNIDVRATSDDVKKAVEEQYKVKPVKVNVAKVASKNKTRRTRSGVTSGKTASGKKAYVYLKKGETIAFA